MALSKIQTGLLADGSVDTAQLAGSAVTDAKIASTLDISGKTVTYGLSASDAPSGTIVQYQMVRLDGQRSWTHSAYDTWKHILSINFTPLRTTSTLRVRGVIGGYSHSNATGGRGHIKIKVNTSNTYNQSFGYEYGYGIGNVPGQEKCENMLAQDSNSTAGTQECSCIGTETNSDGSTKYFVLVGAMQDTSSGTFHVNTWSNQSYLEVWEVA